MKNRRVLLFSCLALAAAASADPHRRWAAADNSLQIRGLFDPPDTTTTDTDTTSTEEPTTTTEATTTEETTTATTPTTTEGTTTTTDATTTDTATTTSPTTTTGTPTTTTGKDTTTTAATNTGTTTTDKNGNTKTDTTTAQSTAGPETSHVVTTNDNGDATTIFTTYTRSSASSAPSSSSSSDGSEGGNDDESSGISTGSIIGMSVAGGVAVIGFVCFIIWKFTRKRQADFDDNEAIKWPELNSHGDGGSAAALPVGTGRFDDGSNISLSRQNSGGNQSYMGGASNYSTAELAHDPYGVPPLPHLNPSQGMPYRDDPSAGSAYYDPYRGPVPQFGPIPGEAIPMQQYGGDMHAGYGDPARVASPMRMASPAPSQAYGLGAQDQIARTASPMRMASPAPPGGGGYGLGPQAAYDPVTFHGGR